MSDYATRLYAQNRQDTNELVLEHLYLVGYVISRLKLHLPPPFDEEDLHEVGVVGLVAAARTYDPSRDVTFKTYAYLKIRGAIVDELRSRTPLPRGQVRKLKSLDDITREYFKEHGCAPPVEVLAERSGLSQEEVERLLVSARAASVLSLDYKSEGAGPGEETPPTLADMVSSPHTLDPGEAAGRAELLERMAEAMMQLPERDRQVLVLYYHDNLLLKEIGAVLGVSESRVCQLHARAIYRLRQAMQSAPVGGRSA